MSVQRTIEHPATHCKTWCTQTGDGNWQTNDGYILDDNLKVIHAPPAKPPTLLNQIVGNIYLLGIPITYPIIWVESDPARTVGDLILKITIIGFLSLGWPVTLPLTLLLILSRIPL